MLIDNPLKRVQVDCLIAFAHSRIAGIAGKEHLRDQKGLYFFGSLHVHRGIRKYAV